VQPIASRLEKLQSGSMDLEMIAQTPDGKDQLGFQVSGPFSFAASSQLPVFDLTSTRLVGAQKIKSRVVSTGDAAFVVDGTTVTALSGDARASLQRRDGGSGAVRGLHLTSWMTKPKRTASGSTVHIAGAADVPVVVRDLLSLVQGFGSNGAVNLASLGDVEATALRNATKSATVSIDADADDHDLHHLDVRIEFASKAISDPKSPLARFAGITLTLRLDLRDNGAPVHVVAPV
jgi:hypothetical protein